LKEKLKNSWAQRCLTPLRLTPLRPKIPPVDQSSLDGAKAMLSFDTTKLFLENLW
jgi:hypothetical protein